MALWAVAKRRPLLWGAVLLTVFSFWLLLRREGASSPVLSETYDHPKPGKHWTSFADVSNLVVFGDSWSSIELKTCDMFEEAEASHFGNPKFPGITSTNGLNWVGYLAQVFNRSVLHTYDLAIAGSVTDNSIISGAFDNDFGSALSQLIDPGPHCPYLPKNLDPEKTLFAIFLGVNDIMACLTNVGTRNPCDIHRPPLSELFKSFTASMESLYASGARNFLMFNAPPFSSDVALGPPSLDEPTKAAIQATHLFNQHHRQLVQYLRTTLADVTIFEFDTWDLFQKVHRTPQAVEDTAIYKNVTGICPFYGPFKFSEGQLKWTGSQAVTQAEIDLCHGLRPEEYLWNSPGHVTWPVHKAIARGVVDVMDAHVI